MTPAELKALGVRIKPLEWVENNARTSWVGYSILNSQGPNGEWDWFKWSHSSRGDWDDSDGEFPTAKLAKAAAQGDHEARIAAMIDVVKWPN